MMHTVPEARASTACSHNCGQQKDLQHQVRGDRGQGRNQHACKTNTYISSSTETISAVAHTT